MIQLKIAFLDGEEAYLERLRGYLVRKKEMFFDVWTFSSAEAFLKKEKEISFQAVLMTAPFWDLLRGYTFSGKKILLCEDGRKEVDKDCLSVEKYQAADALFCRISELFWQEENDEGEVFCKASELIGIYSSVHHESQMLFGMTMAQILGEGQKVLYVNLMEHSGFFRLTGTEAAEDIGDLAYGMLDGNFDFTAGLNRVRKTYQSFDYIPPVKNPEHLSELTDTLFEKLLLSLKNRSGYDIVLIDFGMVFSGFARLLPLFGSFYCIGKEGAANRCRMEEFFEYLNKDEGHEAVRRKQILLPAQAAFLEGTDPIASSLYGGMGDYIRECLYKGAEIGE